MDSKEKESFAQEHIYMGAAIADALYVPIKFYKECFNEKPDSEKEDLGKEDK